VGGEVAVSSDPVLDAALVDGRAEHERLMVDACTITRPGTPTLDRATSQLTPGTPTALYAGKCRLKAQRIPRPEEAGEELVSVARYELALPFSAALPAGEELRVGDEVTMTASADARLVGQKLHVMAVDFGSTATAWRLTVEDQT
jgi:hypothetical protein